jgi:hypothetical protein
MRGFARWTLTGFVVLSLLLFIASAGMGVRSYWTNDYVTYAISSNPPPTCTILALNSNRGHCVLGYQIGDVRLANGLHYTRQHSYHWTGPATFWNHLGFSYSEGNNVRVSGYRLTYRTLHVPFYLLALLALILPGFGLHVWRRQRRASASSPAPIVQSAPMKRPKLPPLGAFTIAAFALFFAFMGCLGLTAMLLLAIVHFPMPDDWIQTLAAQISCVVIGTPLGLWMLRIRRRGMRARAGCCMRCGYDLRASTGRCSECGTEFEVSNISNLKSQI